MRFGRVLFMKKPKIYRELSDDWNNALKNAQINVTTEADIRRIGQGAVNNIG